MTKLAAKLQTMRQSDKGATMVEYGLMVALIAVIVVLAVGPLGQAISTMFQNITGAI